MVFFMPHSRAVIFANGILPDLEAARALLREDDTLLAADGGALHVLALGLRPAVVIGDMDSLPQETVRDLEDHGALLMRFPPEKDETDLELAIRYARENGHRAILIVAGLGGRTDQSLANLAQLSDPALAGVDIRLDDGVEQAFFIRAGASLAGDPGDTVSLIPWGVPAIGVVTAGLRYPLNDETLDPHRTRGISNEMLGESASMSIRSGLLLCIHRRNS
jgi:thiamine pyrophosphokinase